MTNPRLKALPRIPPKHLKDGCYARADALEAHLEAAKAENERLTRERDERAEWAEAWHRALETVATVLEVPSAGSDKMLLRDISEAIDKLRAPAEPDDDPIPHLNQRVPNCQCQGCVRLAQRTNI